MSQNASEITAIMCSQNNMADASFSAWPRRLVTAPEDIKITKIDQHQRLNNFFFPFMLIGNSISNHICYLKLETSELGWFVPGKIVT
jgi:DNA-binding LacI/PurR family transcriptional regulator